MTRLDLQANKTSRARLTRIMIHCHDSFGIGHLRRSLNLATSLRRQIPSCEVLITSGSPCATHFELPDGVDVLKLPSVTKDEAGDYVPRRLGGGLGAIVRMRRRVLLEAFLCFSPDLVIADHQPLGLCGELTDVLEEAHSTGVRTFLGLRDIIDEKAAVDAEWGRPHIRHALTKLYDRIVVYGRQDVFDVRHEYDLEDAIADKLEYTGYIGRPAQISTVRAVPSLRSEVLVTVGGGEDGVERVDTYLELVEEGQPVWNSCLVLGPLFPQKEVRRVKRRARLLRGLDVHSFHHDIPRLLAQSDAVVSMAGYNSVVEIMQSGKPAVFWPRSFPRREQLIRAERLELRGLAACVAEPTTGKLRREVELALDRGVTRRSAELLGGCKAVSRIVIEDLGLEACKTNQRVI